MTQPPEVYVKRTRTALAATRLGWVAGVFCLLVIIGLAVDFANRRIEDPLDAPEILSLKEELAANPRDEALKTQIRRLDRELREDYFRHRRFTAIGAGLLLVGGIVFFAALKARADAIRKPPIPGPAEKKDAHTQVSRRARFAVVATLGILFAAAIFGSRSAVEIPLDFAKTKDPGESQVATVAVPTATDPAPAGGGVSDPQPAADISGAASPEEISKNWPRFRGPGGLGIAPESGVPSQWSVPEGKNLLWKTEVPLPGNNSPVVWNDRVFLTGATEEERKVFCFDAADGKLLWTKAVPSTPESTAEVPEVMEDTGFAAPTAATNGRGIFAIFANGDLAAFDFDGGLAWSRHFGPLKNMYGHAASLCVFEDLLIVQLDQAEAKDNLSKLYALNTADGTTAWEAPRDVRNSWTSPILADTPTGKQLITSAAPWAISYDAKTGKELWRAKAMTQDVGPSPAYAAGTAFFANEFPGLLAIAADGSGDVTDSKILWKAEDGLPDTSSPLATETMLLLVSSYGIVTCYDPKSGEMLWEEEFEATFSSSPTLVGNRLFLFATHTDPEGMAWVVEPTPEGCNRISENTLGENCVTSPAIVADRLYIRGATHLMCIGASSSAE